MKRKAKKIIKLSDHFTYRRLLRFVFPSIVMMIFTSVYGVVDGIFVANFAGDDKFAALNLIIPVVMIFGTLGFMVGTGGSAIVSKTLGEGDTVRANRYFSFLVYATVAGGVLLSIIGEIGMPYFAKWLGAEGQTVIDCTLYGRILVGGTSFFMLQNVFQGFMVTAEKPRLGLAVTVAAGVTNMILDYLLVGQYRFGLAGAASATVISQIIGGMVPLIYFAGKHSGTVLHLMPAKIEWGVLCKACTNGSSELMTNVSMSLVTILYNSRLMYYIGNDGVSAYGVIMYVNFVFVSMFIGYAIGSAPIIGYHFGAANHRELQNIFRKSLVIVGIDGLLMVVTAEICSAPIVRLFVGRYDSLNAITKEAFRINALSFLFCGVSIFGSSFFTALSNGFISALISFMRTLVFQVISVLAFSYLFGVTGIWFAVIAAEGLSFLLSVFCFARMKDRYHY